MIPIAIALLLIVAVFTVAIVLGNPGGAVLVVGPAVIPMTYGVLYAVGGAAMLVLIVGLALMRIGLRRAGEKRRELRRLRQDQPASTAPDVPVQRGRPSRNAAKVDRGAPTVPTASRMGAAATGSVDTSRVRRVDPPPASPQPAASAVSSERAGEREVLADEAEETSGDEPLR